MSAATESLDSFIKPAVTWQSQIIFDPGTSVVRLSQRQESVYVNEAVTRNIYLETT